MLSNSYPEKLGLWNSYPCCTARHLQCSASEPRCTFFCVFQPAPHTLSTMVCRHISVKVKELALSLSLQGLSDSEIHDYTRISIHTIQRVQSLHRRTGNVTAPPPLNIGRPHTLASTQILVRLRYLCPVRCLTDTAQYL